MEELYEKFTKQILDDMKANKEYKGYQYTITAIKILKDLPQMSLCILYESIARRHRTTASKVERNIRYLVDSIDTKTYFNSPLKLSNRLFLFQIRQYVLNKIKMFLMEQEISTNAL